MKPSYAGIVGGIIAFISLILPWWTMTQAANMFGTTISTTWNVYPYRVGFSGYDFGIDYEIGERLWFGWVSFALVVVAGTLGIIGGTKCLHGVLLAGSALAISSILVFAVGLQMELVGMPFMRESPPLLFYFGYYANSLFYYSIYLSFGFWLAFVSGILMLAASTRRGRAMATRAGVPTPPPAT